MVSKALSLLVCGVFFQASALSTLIAVAQQRFRVTGTIVDASTGQSLVHVRVTIVAATIPDSEQSVVTAEDGKFAFENLAPGHYALSAGRRGYVSQAYKQHEFFSTAIIVGPDLPTSDLRFELYPDASISGHVLDEMNEPVRHAGVLLFRQGLQDGTRKPVQQSRVSTDDRGYYEFGQLRSGTYFVAVSAQPWYARHVTHQRVTQFSGDGRTTYTTITNGEPELDVVYPITFFPNAPDISAAAPITLSPGDEQKADFNLQPVQALHLTIRAADWREGENIWGQATQQIADGVLEGVPTGFQQLEPGLLEITGLPPGRLNVTLQFRKGDASRSQSQTLQLAQDAEFNTSEMASAAGVSGTAKMDDGSPLTSVAVSLHNRTTGEGGYMPVEANGEFALKNRQMAAGTYDLMINASSAVGVKALSATNAKVSGQTIEIAGGQDVRISLVITKGTGHISGVALKDGKPVDGVMVLLVPPALQRNLALVRRDQSDSDGTFNLPNAVPGKYTVVALENWDLDWSTAGVLEKYLKGGEAVEVAADSKLEVRVNVQR
jgi:carboxypeptidase family protein